MIRIRSAVALLCAVALAACDKNGVQELTAIQPAARVKFFNFAVGGPAVNFYANDAKVTAISSTTGTESTNGTAYGSVGSGGYYSGIAPGQYTFSGRIAAATDKDVAIATLPATVADGKSYSLYLTGFYDAAAKKADAFIVEDSYVDKIDYTVAYVRFVNASPNAGPMTLYAKHTITGTETAVGSAVNYKSAGAFTALPPGSYDLSARAPGASTNLIARAGVGFNAGVVYTVSARGDVTVTSTTAANRPILDNTANR